MAVDFVLSTSAMAMMPGAAVPVPADQPSDEEMNTMAANYPIATTTDTNPTNYHPPNQYNNWDNWKRSSWNTPPWVTTWYDWDTHYEMQEKWTIEEEIYVTEADTFLPQYQNLATQRNKEKLHYQWRRWESADPSEKGFVLTIWACKGPQIILTPSDSTFLLETGQVPSRHAPPQNNLTLAFQQFKEDYNRDPGSASLPNPPFIAYLREMQEGRSRSPPPQSAYALRMQDQQQYPHPTRRSTPSLSAHSGRSATPFPNDDAESSSTAHGEPHHGASRSHEL